MSAAGGTTVGAPPRVVTRVLGHRHCLQGVRWQEAGLRSGAGTRTQALEYGTWVPQPVASLLGPMAAPQAFSLSQRPGISQKASRRDLGVSARARQRFKSVVVHVTEPVRVIHTYSVPLAKTARVCGAV